MAHTDDEIRSRYRELTGRDHEGLPDDHPDRWQWDYRGRPEEREGLLERLSEEPDAAAAAASGRQETLFE